MDQADLGKRALAAGRYEEAITQYTAALESVSSPDYLIQRATAYQRTQNYQSALNDAEKAVIFAQKRAKRELIVEAQFRRGCALHSLERYGDAQFVFALVKKMEDKHKMISAWIGRNDNSLKRLAAGDAKAQCVVTETPEVYANGGVKALPAADGPSSTPAAPVAAPPQQTPAEKIRHEWYQNSTHVYFTVFAKGVPQDKLQIDIRERSLNISFPLVTGASYDLTLDPLFAPLNVEKCVINKFATKFEVILAKAVSDQKWSKIESSEPTATLPKLDDTKETNEAVKQAVLNDATNTGPAYPTSSKSGPKNWDKVVDGALRADSTGKGGIEDDDDYEGGDEANHFFKKLYKGASPDVQKAMMKSYTESNGTALSTNWDEVSKGKVETVPPNGMEAKSYEQ